MTRTNAPMNNRVILFREPIRLSVVQKVRVGATEEREREKKREKETETGRSESRDTREEKRTKKREELRVEAVSPGIAAQSPRSVFPFFRIFAKTVVIPRRCLARSMLEYATN